MNVPFSEINRTCREKGLAFLSFLIIMAALGFGRPETCFSASLSLTESSEFKSSVEQSRQILSALFLEEHYRYEEALRIWKALPSNNAAVTDHIFKDELLLKDPSITEMMPKTVQSMEMAVSYLKWKNHWQQAYHLLQYNPDLVSADQELQMIQVMFALFTRNYQDAEQHLKLLDTVDTSDNVQLETLWYWYYLLTGRLIEASKILTKLEQEAFYLPSSSILFDLSGYPRENVKGDIMKALTRFPSDRELFESAMMMFNRDGDTELLEALIESGTDLRKRRVPWTIRARVYLDTGRIKDAKRLLTKRRITVDESVEYLDLRARIAYMEKNRSDLERVARQFMKSFPNLTDGRMWMALCHRRLSDK